MEGHKFVIFEGGEGSGKDTQIDFLKEHFSGRPGVTFTREPGGTEMGEKIRALVLDKASAGMAPETELLLFLSARAQLLNEVIKPKLDRGETVISNRFGLSTIAYQIYGRQRPEYLDFLRKASEFVVGKYTPTLTVLFDVDPTVGIRRVNQRADANTRFDDEKLEFHRRVREGFLEHVGEYGDHVVIDAGKTIEEVRAEVLHTLSSRGIQ